MIHYITATGIGQAWVGNELRVMEKCRIPLRLHAMRSPDAAYFDSGWAFKLNTQTSVLYPLPPWRTVVALVLAPLRFKGRFFAALGNALFSSRENIRARMAGIAHFVVACYWASRLRRESVSLIHAQWAFSSATIGMYGAWLIDAPFSFTGHATDLFRDRVALVDKIKRSAFIVCISKFHRDLYMQLGAGEAKLRLAYCGIDVAQFSPGLSQSTSPPLILSSGRLVEKKGFPVLIDACKRLRDRQIDFKCKIGGSGPLEGQLRRRIDDHGLHDLVELTGKALKQEEIADFMRAGTVYCLPCIQATDGDIDGLPQMLMEAMACETPVVSTRLVGIPDLVIDDETGLLVDPDDAEQAAVALERMLTDDGLRERLGTDGRKWVCQTFNLKTSLNPIITEFRSLLRRAAATG